MCPCRGKQWNNHKSGENWKRYLKKAIILTTIRRKRIRTKEEENEEEEDEAGRLTQLTLIATSSAILRCVN